MKADFSAFDGSPQSEAVRRNAEDLVRYLINATFSLAGLGFTLAQVRSADLCVLVCDYSRFDETFGYLASFWYYWARSVNPVCERC